MPDLETTAECVCHGGHGPLDLSFRPYDGYSTANLNTALVAKGVKSRQRNSSLGDRTDVAETAIGMSTI